MSNQPADQSDPQWRIIAVPVLAALVFSFGYLQFMTAPVQPTASTPVTPADSNDRLPLVTQPLVPQLTPLVVQETQPPTTPPTSSTPLVGPSPTDAANRLQGVEKNHGQSKKDVLQASPKQLNLNELKL